MFTIEIGDFILAPRPRYSVEEIEYTPQLRQGALNGNACGTGSACNGSIKNWEIVLHVHCIGRGDLAAARRAYKDLESLLNSICASNALKFKKFYCAEDDPLEHYLSGGYIKPINLDWKPDCCDVTTLSGEMHLITVDVDAGAELLFYNYHTLVPA